MGFLKVIPERMQFLTENPITPMLPPFLAPARVKFCQTSLPVGRDLRDLDVPNVFVTGDTAKAASDDLSDFAIVSCQDATRVGAFAGNPAAACREIDPQSQ